MEEGLTNIDWSHILFCVGFMKWYITEICLLIKVIWLLSNCLYNIGQWKFLMFPLGNFCSVDLGCDIGILSSPEKAGFCPLYRLNKNWSLPYTFQCLWSSMWARVILGSSCFSKPQPWLGETAAPPFSFYITPVPDPMHLTPCFSWYPFPSPHVSVKSRN